MNVVLVLAVRGINRALRLAVTELSDGAQQVAALASQVSLSSQSLAQGSSEQAASNEATSASSEEINSMARQNAENSKTAIHIEHVDLGEHQMDSLRLQNIQCRLSVTRESL